MKILGIETSCDETSTSIVENGKNILSLYISSQEKLHKKFGGIVPEIASRRHTEVLNYLIKKALNKAKISFNDLKGVATTVGPGLEGSLIVGVSAAKIISYIYNIPLIPVNHLEAHIYSNFLGEETPSFPFVSLIVSGGHTELVYCKDHINYEVVGKTRDDAAGEAFDKIARALNLGFPGGPIIDKLAKRGNRDALKFPRAYLGKESFDFSFSGLKTSLIYYLKNTRKKEKLSDICASIQAAIVEVLVNKTISLARKKNVKTILLAGGVAANSSLRKEMEKEAKKNSLKLFYPEPYLCTDNAAMVACCGYYKLKKNILSDIYSGVDPNLNL
jgi:N6-L-threonylcarbamoyladenine synthase